MRDGSDKSQCSVEADLICFTVDEQKNQGQAELMGVEK